jgi:hypothetical protein
VRRARAVASLFVRSRSRVVRRADTHSAARAAYLGELHAAQLRPRGGAGARGAFSLSIESLLAPDSLAFEPAGFAGLEDAGPPPSPVFNRGGGDRRIAGAPAALLHAALRVVIGARPAFRDALYAPLLQHAAARRAQRG